MPLSNEELETLEKKYLDQLYYHLKSREEVLMRGLRSKDKIRYDWWDQFREGGKATDLDRGAERIFHWILAGLPDWMPNSAPIGSNLLFETQDAFIHIEVKTARVDNPSDYRGLVPLNVRQTSYLITSVIGTPPALPKYYNEGGRDEKACLTFGPDAVVPSPKSHS